MGLTVLFQLKSAEMPLGAPSVHSTMILRAPGSFAACSSFHASISPSAVPVLPLDTMALIEVIMLGVSVVPLKLTSGPVAPVGGFVPQSPGG